MPGGESLAGVCAGRRRRRSQRRAGGAQRRSTSHRRPCGVRSSPTSLNAGFPGKLTPHRRDDCGVPQQVGRRLARQVTRQRGVSDPLGGERNRLRGLTGGALTPRIAVSRRRQAAADCAAAGEAAPRRSTASPWSADSCAREAIELAGSQGLSGSRVPASTRGTKASRRSVPSFVPLLQ